MIQEQKITNFLQEHHVLTLATSRDSIPWCANCFYAFDEETASFVFSSDLTTRHGAEAHENNIVAGSVVLETKTIGKIQGIQFSGKMYIPEGELLFKVNRLYLKKFPYAILKDTHLWVLELSYIKMTDNRLGFGKKLTWNRNI